MNKNLIKTLPLKIAKWLGSPVSLLIHTVIISSLFGLIFFGINFDRVMWVITTLLSLEAIYLAIFLQMTQNYHGTYLKDISIDVDEILSDTEELTEEEKERVKSIFKKKTPQ